MPKKIDRAERARKFAQVVNHCGGSIEDAAVLIREKSNQSFTRQYITKVLNAEGYEKTVRFEKK